MWESETLSFVLYLLRTPRQSGQSKLAKEWSNPLFLLQQEVRNNSIHL
jgi:hypothetical protein